MKIQYISDIHLEYLKELKLECDGEILVLAGDIGIPHLNDKYYNFIEKYTHEFRYIIIVPGNHEYYHHWKKDKILDIEQVNLHLENLTKQFTNVILLQDNHILIDNIYIYGCTLWTQISEEEAPYNIRNINDYKRIFINSQHTLNVDYVNEMNLIHLEKLICFLDKAKDQRDNVVIVTHHCPIQNNDYDDKIISAFNNDLGELVNDYKDIIKLWIYGHTHENLDFIQYNVRFVTNASHNNKIKNEYYETKFVNI